MNRAVFFLSMTAVFMFIAGCGGTKVTRMETDTVVDVSGRWNDTDSRMVAEEMINDCISRNWLFKWEEKSVKPTLIVGRIVNKTHEHISIDTFVKDIERVLLNSGKVNFVANKEERDQIRDEKMDQHDYSSTETAKQMGEETGADLMLIGTISTIVDQEGKKAVVFYQVDMELIDIESNMKVWIGNKKIKKYVERSKTKF